MKTSVQEGLEGVHMVDVNDTEKVVEITLSGDETTLWVNVDGRCVCRVNSRRRLPLKHDLPRRNYP
jgi:hypothetical protein